MNEERIYVVVPKTVQPGSGISSVRSINQSYGRMSAQASHAEALLRHSSASFPKDKPFLDLATIALECRDTAEMYHIMGLVSKKNIQWVLYFDSNPEAYKTQLKARIPTAIAILLTKKQSIGILDYLPRLGKDWFDFWFR